MRRVFSAAAMVLVAAIICTAFAGCGNRGFSAGSAISVISREAGSGTRGAFVELFGVEQKDAQGNKVDKTIASATTSNSTGVVLTTVSSDINAIGYISLGSLNSSVKALKIDGAEPTAENIISGTYSAARPFNIATKGKASGVAADFIDYILSSDGQKIVGNSGFIPLSADKAYSGLKPSGKVVVAGSSSVTPLMEKLKEAYLRINPNAKIEINQSDSSSGMTSTAEGVCDIGMASRELKDSETSQGLVSTVIARDGIVIAVNPQNTLDGLSTEQVRDIYTGVAKNWVDVGAK